MKLKTFPSCELSLIWCVCDGYMMNAVRLCDRRAGCVDITIFNDSRAQGASCCWAIPVADLSIQPCQPLRGQLPVLHCEDIWALVSIAAAHGPHRTGLVTAVVPYNGGKKRFQDHWGKPATQATLQLFTMRACMYPDKKIWSWALLNEISLTADPTNVLDKIKEMLVNIARDATRNWDACFLHCQLLSIAPTVKANLYYSFIVDTTIKSLI